MNYLPAFNSGSRSDIHKPISGKYGVLVVLYNNQSVAEVPKSLQCLNKPSIVPLVKADAWFIKHIKYAREACANLSSQPDSLGFTTRK